MMSVIPRLTPETERVGGLGRLGPPVPPCEEASRAVVESREERDDVRIGGRRQAVEEDRPRGWRRARGDALRTDPFVFVARTGNRRVRSREEPPASPC